jgi:cytochrome c heme-lyase
MHQQAPPPPSPPPGCPMHNTDSPASDHAPMGQVNSLNNIPDLAQAPSPGQQTFLPLERTISSIPRANTGSASASACPVAHSTSTPATTGGNTAAKEEKTEQWEYPSPQQFYNALVRKGWETPEESVEMMVNIHNWLNEEAWQQVRRWEEKHDGFVFLFLPFFLFSSLIRFHLTVATVHLSPASKVDHRRFRRRLVTI